MPKKTTVNIRDDIYEKFKEHKSQTGATITNVINIALKRFFEKNNLKKAKQK